MSYGKVHDIFWEDDKIDGLSDRAALLALFLITGPHRNAIGCFRLGMGAITDHDRFKKWGIEGVSDALSELLRMGFIVRDEKTGWTFITNALKHDPIKGAKAAVHALGLADRVPKNIHVYRELKRRLEPQLQTEAKHLEGKEGWPMPSPFDTPSDTPSKGYTIPQPSPLPLPEPLPEPPPQPHAGPTPARAIVDRFLALRSELWPNESGFPAHGTTLETIAREWLGGGGSVELICETIERGMRNMAKSDPNAPTSLNAFRKSVTSAIARANQRAREQGEYVPAEKPNPELMQKSRDRMVGLFKTGTPWHPDLGPEPGKPGCLASPEVLREHGFLDAPQSAVNGRRSASAGVPATTPAERAQKATSGEMRGNTP